MCSVDGSFCKGRYDPTVGCCHGKLSSLLLEQRDLLGLLALIARPALPRNGLQLSVFVCTFCAPVTSNARLACPLDSVFEDLRVQVVGGQRAAQGQLSAHQALFFCISRISNGSPCRASSINLFKQERTLHERILLLMPIIDNCTSGLLSSFSTVTCACLLTVTMDFLGDRGNCSKEIGFLTPTFRCDDKGK